MGVFVFDGFGIASVKMTLNGAPGFKVVTFGFMHDTEGGGFIGSADTMATTIRDAISGTGDLFAAASFSSDYTFSGVDVVIERGTGHQIGTAPASVVGTISASSLPPNCAFLVKKTTARGGRKGRGRMYLPPAWVSEGNVFGTGFYAPGQTAATQTKLDAMRVDLAAAGLPMYLLHQNPVEVPDAVTGLVLQPQIATQRRRLR